jgi:hypothetical protein
LFQIRKFPFKLKMAETSGTLVVSVTTFQHHNSNYDPVTSSDEIKEGKGTLILPFCELHVIIG